MASNKWTDFLKDRQIPFRVLGSVEQGQLIILERGARLWAMLPPNCSETPLWLNPSELDNGGWNVGGDRFWISPELDFFTDTDGAYSIPQALDPGTYTFRNDSLSGSVVAVEQSIALQNRRSSQTIELQMQREFRLADNPLQMNELRSSKGDLTDVAFVGYASSTLLMTYPNSRYNDTLSWCNLWSIMQVPPNGKVIIPTIGAAEPLVMFRSENWHSPIYEANSHHLAITYSGTELFKLSLNALQSTGRFGYLRKLDDGSVSLIVRQFQVQPSGFYPDYPANQPNYKGSCMQFFYDGGQMGKFGELEYHTPAILCDGTSRSIMDQSQVWHYSGNEAKIREIVKILLGVEIFSDDYLA